MATLLDFARAMIPNPIRQLMRRVTFPGSANYWERRYVRGGNSGATNFNRPGKYKAEFLNSFVKECNIDSVVEFGSGDGVILEMTDFPKYLGLDISKSAVNIARRRMSTRLNYSFSLLSDAHKTASGDLSLSLDVVYHLVEDTVFEEYMIRLFNAAKRFVIIYASNGEYPSKHPHIRHRRFTDWVTKNRADFELIEVVENPLPADPNRPEDTTFASFHIFKRSP